MTLKTIEKTFRGETLVFTNLRGLFWTNHKSLIISDLHIGKTAFFRKSGIAVPSGILEDDLARLEYLCQHFAAEELIIVGDFLHAGRNTDFLIFEAWRKKNPKLKLTLIKGNHDIRNAAFLHELEIKVFEDSLDIPPFCFIHEPAEHDTNFTVSGHLHPGVTLQLEKRKSVRLPCFRYSDQQIILPAFSNFTGLDTQSCRNFKCIAFTEDLIFEV